MAERGLAPLSSLGREAVAARIAQQALAQGELAYFHPVAALPESQWRLPAECHRTMREAAIDAPEARGRDPARVNVRPRTAVRDAPCLHRSNT